MGDKTVRRDLAELRDAGVPLIESVGEFGRKTFAIDHQDVPLLSFTFDEALALFLCNQAILPLADTYFWESANQAFAKIEATLGKKARSYVERMRGHFLRTGLAGNYGDKAALLDQIVMGLEECRAVFIEYHSQSATEPVTRDIFPLGIVEHRGAVYIVAFSPGHDEIRTWKLDRILSAEKTSVPFQRPADFSLQTYLKDSFGIMRSNAPAQRITVRFAAKAARLLQEKAFHPSQQLIRDPTGQLLVTFDLSTLEEFRSWLLSWGPLAEVVEPETLREEMRESLKQSLQKYEHTEETKRPSEPLVRKKTPK